MSTTPPMYCPCETSLAQTLKHASNKGACTPTCSCEGRNPAVGSGDGPRRPLRAGEAVPAHANWAQNSRRRPGGNAASRGPSGTLSCCRHGWLHSSCIEVRRGASKGGGGKGPARKLGCSGPRTPGGRPRTRPRRLPGGFRERGGRHRRLPGGALWRPREAAGCGVR